MIKNSLGRLKTFISRPQRLLYQRAIDRAHISSAEMNSSDYESVNAILTRYRTDGGLQHDFQAYKLFQLKMLLRRIKPKRILELGSGSSTALFAEYVRQADGKCFVCSIDDDDKWLEQAKRMAWNDIPYAGLAEFIRAPRTTDVSSFPPESRYDIVLDEAFDFVFIDGPPMRIGNIKNKSMVNSNIFDLVEKNPPQTIVVVVRRPTVEEIVRRCGLEYNSTVSDLILGKANRLNYNYFSLFERKGA